jgi:hypothetical protein
MYMTDHASFQPAAGGGSGAGRDDAAWQNTPADHPASIEARLEAGEGLLAARMLLAAVSHGAFPDGLALSEWLDNRLGEARRAKLISAFAHYPCFACRTGQEACDTCTGSGFSADAQVCMTCAGFGERRCDFCAGSGLAAYALMPVELWPGVLAARTIRALRYLEKLIAQPTAVTVPLTEAAAARRVHDVNKLLGVIENALETVRQLAESGIVTPRGAAEFHESCKRPATGGMAAMRDALHHLAAHHERYARTLPPADAANAEAKAEFYEDLAASPAFAGTGLSHPFLPVDGDDASIDRA